MKAVTNFFNFEVIRVKFFNSITAANARWLVLTIALVFSFWPIRTEQHSLMPKFARMELGLSDIKPWLQGINRLSPGQFKIFVGIDYAENLSLKTIADHERAAQQIDDEELVGRARAYPWRYVKSIAFLVATFQRKNICKLRLVLDDGTASDAVDCKSIQDNHLVSFHFEKWIKPGIHTVVLESTGEQGQEIAPYYASASNQDAWIIPFQGRLSVCFWEYIISLGYRQPYMAIAYLLLMTFLLWSLVGRVSALWKLMTIYVSSIIFANLATLPFSGHDETAHMSMYQQALKENSLTKMADTEFNSKTWKAMAESDFFRLHDVEPRDPEECPHQIIGSCGISRNPTELYSFYARSLDWFGLKFTEPLEIIILGRFFNLAMIFGFITLAAIILRRDELQNLITVLVFLGGFIAQSASLTNDAPMFLLGCAALLVCPIVMMRKWYFGLMGIAVLCLFYSALRKVDVSSVTVLPLLIGLALLLIFKALMKGPRSSPTRLLHTDLSNPIMDVFGLIGLILLFISLSRSIPNVAYIVEHLRPLEPRAAIIYDFWQLPPNKIPGILQSYWKSYVGTFVWGHSYWPNWYYLLAFSAYMATIYQALSNLKSHFSRFHNYTCIILIAGISSIQLVSVLSIAAVPSFLTDAIARDSFTKVRLTAPLAVGLLVLPMMSSKLVSQSSSLAGILIRAWLLIFAMASCFWLPTRFFFADIF